MSFVVANEPENLDRINNNYNNMKDLKGEILKQLDKDFPNVEKWKYESYVGSIVKVFDFLLSQQRKEVLEDYVKYLENNNVDGSGGYFLDNYLTSFN